MLLHNKTERPPTIEPLTVFTVRGSSHNGHAIKIKAARILVGSSQNATLRLIARGVDPAHCLIIRGRLQTIFRALSPTVRLNGIPTMMGLLNPGDALAIGPVELVFGKPSESQPHRSSASMMALSPSQLPASPSGPVSYQSANNGEAPQPYVSVSASFCAAAGDCFAVTVPQSTGCVAYQTYVLGVSERGPASLTHGVSCGPPAYLAAEGKAQSFQHEPSETAVLEKHLADLMSTWGQVATMMSEPIGRLSNIGNCLEKGVNALNAVAVRLESVGSAFEKWSRWAAAVNLEAPRASENPNQYHSPNQPGISLAGDNSSITPVAQLPKEESPQRTDGAEPAGVATRSTPSDDRENTPGPAPANSEGGGSSGAYAGSSKSAVPPQPEENRVPPPPAGSAATEPREENGHSNANPEEPFPCEHDQAVKNYMNELLARLRSASQASKTARPDPTSAGRAHEKDGSEAANNTKKRGPVVPSPAKSRPFPRKKVGAPEKHIDFAAMRELANLSSQAAIDRYAKAKLAQAQKGKLTVLLTALVCGAALLALDYFVAHSPAVRIAFFVDLVVVLVYGLQYALLTGRLIVNPKGQLQLAQRRIGREMRKLVPSGRPLVNPQGETNRVPLANEVCDLRQGEKPA